MNKKNYISKSIFISFMFIICNNNLYSSEDNNNSMEENSLLEKKEVMIPIHLLNDNRFMGLMSQLSRISKDKETYVPNGKQTQARKESEARQQAVRDKEIQRLACEYWEYCNE